MQFVAIDVETANADLASICQVGVAKFVDGVLAAERSWLVDPQDYFDPINVDIHGITARAVKGQPTFPEIAPAIVDFLASAVCVSHTHFDRASLTRAFGRHSLPWPGFAWLDSARVARRAWPDCAHQGYGLAKVCERIGYAFRHHDALEDAKACGNVVLAAIRDTGISLDGWQQRVRLPLDGRTATDAVERDGNPDGDLFGEVLVFTGALEMPRREAADMAAQIGCTVDANVTKKTTMLVVGDQDARKLAGHALSSKHRKAEQLIAGGQAIRILTESDFNEVVRLATYTPAQM
ncbi:MAG: exonuclease domain-containing protein [Steroidobacteraceae bacterium]